MDKFKINWTENNGKEEITCVSGFEYQVDNWGRDFILDSSKKNFKVKKGIKIQNKDGTVTVTFIKTKNLKED
jgi:hypothetical protein